WLYILLHLSNAWRHRDICNLRMIDISFLNIKSLKEFRNRNLANDEVDKIVNLLLTKEYTVSKTKAINNFFISDNIKVRSEEHTSELQSRFDLVCRLLLEKKK